MTRRDCVTHSLVIRRLSSWMPIYVSLTGPCKDISTAMEHHSTSKSGTCFSRTCFNGVNALAGVGILSIPYALSQGGWLSLMLLFAIAAICCYTGLLLQRCMDKNSLVKTYPDIGELAFGHKGRLIVATFMYLELYLVAVEFLIIEGDNLEKLFPKVNLSVPRMRIGSKQAFVLLGALVILPTTWLRSLSMLSYVSLGGVLASLVVVVSVVWVGAFDAVGFHERGAAVKWSGVPTAMSLYAFCYSSHAVFPTIYTSMKDKKLFPKVLVLTFALCTLTYGVMAIVGYLMYGENLKSQVTLNLPSGRLSSKIAIYTTLITPFVKYALVVTPITNAMEDWFLVSKLRSISILIRTCIVISTVVVALAVPFFASVVALTGSFLSSTATMLLPCACYLKLFRDSRRWGYEFLCLVLIILFGSVIAVVGTCASLKQIIQNL